MEKRWVIKKQGDPERVATLSGELNINKHLANLLVQRGITNYQQAKEFFRPELSKLHDPFLMKDMDRAIERIEKAIRNKEKILVYGDYDVDGTTAVSLVYTYLKKFHDQLDFYIPDRYSEGYGISYQSIDFACEKGFSLVIALDCGIKAVEKIAYAGEKGLDFIICDHHRPGDTLPDAVAVLDPQREDCHYPFEELSGCGVGFKLIQAYQQKECLPFEELEQYLDLVVVSIAADIVPVTGENRILAYYGLKLINSNPRPGIEAILYYSNIKRKDQGLSKKNAFSKELNITDLVFLVGPRINAAGRIESANNSVELLVADNFEKAQKFAEQINNFNTERRNLDAQITQEALEMIDQDEEMKSQKATVVFNPEWHKGVIGIVASRLTEVYYRPTVVLTKSNGLITGSARSVKDFDVYDAIDSCSELLEHFGGHKYAAGLSLKPENLVAFKEKFNSIVNETIQDHMLVPEIEIDAILNLSDINSRFFRILKQFAPFGPGNMSPVFLAEKLIDTGHARIVGHNHLKLKVIHREISSLPFPAIAFQQAKFFEDISNGSAFNLCYHLEENEWNGMVSLQINVKDIKIEKAEMAI
ncbi:MAG: single-stranded-DNA-specific exonuclease RecJ [Bacteroidales bacterium]|nr:single-stranded-DNA-specific exonuclease RecJ [Bacteroidales bacterium]MCF8387175.1 single-stranded-DNA-specific exonuclease RecJ [Bacteroidales bacterium]MCF8397667.1 single-stranded-DNA-specific exonuclease RecJ [Bacteroidales bacterium]